MFKEGYIFNYFPGAKGDFLLRFLANLPSSTDKFGMTQHLSPFGYIRGVEGNLNAEFLDNELRTEKYNELMPDLIKSIPTVWPQLTHMIGDLSDENFLLLQKKFKNLYDIIVQEENYNEIIINNFFKNYTRKLNENQLLLIKEKYDKNFNGEYILDREYFLRVDRKTTEFNDDIRLEASYIFWEKLKTLPFTIKEYRDKQFKKNTNKLYYSKLFQPPYEDLIRVYNNINNKDPDLDLYEKLLPNSFVPNEFILFNHKIRLNYESDIIIEVLGRISDETI